MEVQAQAAMSILSMTVQGAHDAMERANVKALSGDASSAAQANTNETAPLQSPPT